MFKIHSFPYFFTNISYFFKLDNNFLLVFGKKNKNWKIEIEKLKISLYYTFYHLEINIKRKLNIKWYLKIRMNGRSKYFFFYKIYIYNSLTWLPNFAVFLISRWQHSVCLHFVNSYLYYIYMYVVCFILHPLNWGND